MIHSARPTVSPVANIVFFDLFCYIWKVWTDGQHVRKQLSLPAMNVGWPSGSIVAPLHVSSWLDQLSGQFIYVFSNHLE